VIVEKVGRLGKKKIFFCSAANRTVENVGRRFAVDRRPPVVIVVEVGSLGKKKIFLVAKIVVVVVVVVF
jgi:hypothetical protein